MDIMVRSNSIFTCTMTDKYHRGNGLPSPDYWWERQRERTACNQDWVEMGRLAEKGGKCRSSYATSWENVSNGYHANTTFDRAEGLHEP